MGAVTDRDDLPYKIGVHVAHCCARHGCKYGQRDCPVKTGQYKQDHPCEQCGEPEEVASPLIAALRAAVAEEIPAAPTTLMGDDLAAERLAADIARGVKRGGVNGGEVVHRVARNVLTRHLGDLTATVQARLDRAARIEAAAQALLADVPEGPFGTV